MFGFLTPVRNEPIDPLTGADAALSFWRSLPRDDAIAAQEAICNALAEPAPRGIPSGNRLQALLVLDRRARALVDSLLANERAAHLLVTRTASRSWQAAFDLCRSFGRVYGLLLRSIRDNGDLKDRRDLQSLVLLRYFRQRQLELLLRPFTDERTPAFAWKEIHDAYVFAQSRWLHREPVPVKREQSRGTVEVRLEREYVILLMQELLNAGQFPPYEASWVKRQLPRWCLGMMPKRDEGPGGANRFVVDLESDAGLVRFNGKPMESSLCLDMTPVLKSLGSRIASLRDATERPSEAPALRQARRLIVLQKVRALCSAERPAIKRRGERKPTAVTVEVAVGLPQILSRVRDKQGGVPTSPPRNRRDSEGATISGFGPPTEDASNTCSEGTHPGAQSSSAGTASHAQLTMVDESDSGCRLHGPALADNSTIPGALIAFREDAASPWRLAIVRRVKRRLAGRRIEIGVEYLGRDPRWVVVVAAESDPDPGKPTGTEPPRFAGLYLLESATQPLLPMKTLVLPACGLSPGDRLSLRSRRSVHTIRLKEPLEEQAGFIWSPFEILDRWTKDEPAAGDP